MVTQSPVLGFYDPKAPRRVTADASMLPGTLGAVLEQRLEEEGKPIAYPARALTETEKRYTLIEKETLAIVFVCELFHEYFYGLTFEVHSDHQLLKSIFKKHLHECPPRIQRHLLRLQRYDFVVCYARGNSIPVPDTLSRNVLMDEQLKLTEDEKAELRLHNVIKSVIPNQQIKDKIREHTASGQELTDTLNYMVHGLPEQFNTDLRPYYNVKESLIHGQREPIFCHVFTKGI